MSEVIEAEATEIAVTGDALPSNLFRTDNPAEVLQRAQETADALMPMVRVQGPRRQHPGPRSPSASRRGPRSARMLGVTPVCQWTRKLDNGWEARVEARTLDGRVIGAAEAECLRAESTWKGPRRLRTPQHGSDPRDVEGARVGAAVRGDARRSRRDARRGDAE